MGYWKNKEIEEWESKIKNGGFGTSSGGWREIFEGKCFNCRRKLRIVITSEASECWSGICKCGYRNIFTSGLHGYDQRIEKVKDGKFKRP